jgi:muramoyltetrapeptide carboxypeptidase
MVTAGREMHVSPRRPRRLRHGSRVALVSPAGPIDEARLAAALEMCASLGLDPVVGRSATARTGYLAGADEARAADLQNAIDDPGIDAIWALRGGYGTMRLLPLVDFTALLDAPRPYIGFSDHTAVHLALARLGIVSFHAPHAGGDLPPFAHAWFERILFGQPAAATAHEALESDRVELAAPETSPLQTWHGGSAEGRIVGGNLALLAALEGTPFAVPSDGAVLFMEDIGEAPYRIDRLLTQLSLSGALERVAAFIIGQFTDCDDPTGSALDLVRAHVSRFGVPVIANAPIGHVPNNWTVPIGVPVRIDADTATVTLLESAVSE